MNPRLAVITIGQAPRKDVLPILQQFFSEADLLHVGVLDELSAAEIQALAPDTLEEGLLTSKLRDDTSVRLSKEKLLPLLQEQIFQVEEQGCELIFLLCTGTFPELCTKNSFLIEPDKLLTALLEQLHEGDFKLGVLMPLADQQQEILPKYENIREVVCTHLSPYENHTPEKIQRVVAFFEQEQCDLILLDCMGYSLDLKETIVQATQTKTIVSSQLISALLAQF